MEIITTPWKEQLLDLVQQSKTSVKITSPFVKKSICEELFRAKKAKTSFELVTTFKLANVHNGSLDLSGLELILDNSGIVKNYPKLHSKIYIFDNEKAIISSSNLTNGGLLHNFEYGVLIDDAPIVQLISNDFHSLWHNVITGTLKMEHIEEAKLILSKIPKIKLPNIPDYEIVTPESRDDLLRDSEHQISSSITGWKLSVFQLLTQIEHQSFSIQDVYRFENRLEKQYPNNKNIRPKIRQQLQYLRDLGLVEFLAEGKYKKLWT